MFYKISEQLYFWLIRLMPKKLQYLTTIDLMAKVTTGKYSKTNAPELTAMEAIRRFGEDFLYRKGYRDALKECKDCPVLEKHNL